MHGAKFTLFYVIAAWTALVFASPVPVAAPGPEERATHIANIDLLAREPLPVAEAVVAREPAPVIEDVESRICTKGGCM